MTENRQFRYAHDVDTSAFSRELSARVEAYFEERGIWRHANLESRRRRDELLARGARPERLPRDAEPHEESLRRTDDPGTIRPLRGALERPLDESFGRQVFPLRRVGNDSDARGGRGVQPGGEPGVLSPGDAGAEGDTG